MDLRALKTELTSDPVHMGYSGMNAVAKRARLRAIVRPGPVEARSVRAALYARGKWTRGVQKRALMPLNGEAAHDNAVAAAVALVKMADQGDSIDMTDSLVAGAAQEDLSALVAIGDLDTVDVAAVLDLAINRSRLRELGWPDIDVADIEAAESLV